jgi:hypothetical protein
MQFAKISGISLLLLGIVLIGLQLALSVAPKTQVSAPGDVRNIAPVHQTTRLPFFFGVAFTCVGGAVFFMNRRGRQADERRAGTPGSGKNPGDPP